MKTQAKTSATSDTTSLLTVVQVCTMLGIGRTKFYTLLDQGLTDGQARQTAAYSASILRAMA